MADRFEDLRNFVAIAECGGVNAAAARLGIAKSAVSRRLADLEQRLGVTLADRTSRRFALTTTGTSVLVDAQRLLADLERLETGLARGASTPVLEVEADRNLLALVAGASAELERAAPGTIVAIGEVGDVGEVGPPGARLRFGIGAVAGEGSVALGIVSRCVYASASATPAVRSAADLRELAAVSVASSGPDEWRFDGVDVTPRVVLTVPDLATALAAAAAGVGIVRAPAYAAERPPWADHLREVFAPREADMTVTAGLPPERSAAADMLVDIVRRELRTD